MFKLLLLIIILAAGQPAVVEGPSAKEYATREDCEADIPAEQAKAQAMIDANEETKGELFVRQGKCFSLDEINRMRGGQSANERPVHASAGRLTSR